MKNLLYRHETYVLAAIIIFITVVSIINPAFFSLENFFDLLKSASLMGTFAIGMLFVLISGGIDISFTAIATVSGYTIAVLLLRIGYFKYLPCFSDSWRDWHLTGIDQRFDYL